MKIFGYILLAVVLIQLIEQAGFEDEDGMIVFAVGGLLLLWMGDK